MNDGQSAIGVNKRMVADLKANAEEQVTAKLFDPVPSTSKSLQVQQQINLSQLHQSRVGLLSQAFMLFIVVGFLCSETLSEFWKTKYVRRKKIYIYTVERQLSESSIIRIIAIPVTFSKYTITMYVHYI